MGITSGKARGRAFHHSAIAPASSFANSPVHRQAQQPQKTLSPVAAYGVVPCPNAELKLELYKLIKSITCFYIFYYGNDSSYNKNNSDTNTR